MREATAEENPVPGAPFGSVVKEVDDIAVVEGCGFPPFRKMRERMGHP
jgi:hypothetical protein